MQKNECVLTIVDQNLKYYEVNKSGHIKGPNMNYFSANWIFRGFSTHHWHNCPTISFEDVLKMKTQQELYQLKTLYVFSIDHGTLNRWGRKIFSAHI